MKIIGLTGPSGAGKSTLCERFESLDIPCINTDEVYYILTCPPSPCLEELKEIFGDKIIAEDGSLDRKALAKLVFEGDLAKSNLAILNATTHKYVWEKTNALLTQYMNEGKKAAVIDAPALFSSKIFVDACDFIISVICDKELRVARIMERDNISREQALARINAQPDDSFFIENSDYYIDNSGSKIEMLKELDTIFEQEEIFSV